MGRGSGALEVCQRSHSNGGGRRWGPGSPPMPPADLSPPPAPAQSGMRYSGSAAGAPPLKAEDFGAMLGRGRGRGGSRAWEVLPMGGMDGTEMGWDGWVHEPGGHRAAPEGADHPAMRRPPSGVQGSPAPPNQTLSPAQQPWCKPTEGIWIPAPSNAAEPKDAAHSSKTSLKNEGRQRDLVGKCPISASPNSKPLVALQA